MRKYLTSVLLFLIVNDTYSQRDETCPRDYECVKRGECEFFKSEIQRSKQFTRGSDAWNDIILPLKSLICNQADKKICCKIQIKNPGSPDSPDYIPGVGECGNAGDAEFIVGGTDTKLGEFPWSALIRKRRRQRWHCGGTLINKWYVLSAAHCVDDDDKVEEVRLGEWKVKDVNKFDHRYCKYFSEDQKQDCENHRFCGSSKRRGNLDCTYENPNVDCMDCPELQDIKVALVKKHPNYGQNQDGVSINDIMMLKLSWPAVYNKLVKPICLPLPDFDNLLGEEGHTPGYFKDQSVVVGWGSTYRRDYKDTNQVASSDQQKLTTPLLSNEDCIESFKTNTGGVVLDISIKEHLCAGGVPGKDSCNGDSGGPLIGREDSVTPLTLIGVVSGGARRCGIGTPAIYTRVSNYRNWILNQMV